MDDKKYPKTEDRLASLDYVIWQQPLVFFVFSPFVSRYVTEGTAKGHWLAHWGDDVIGEPLKVTYDVQIRTSKQQQAIYTSVGGTNGNKWPEASMLPLEVRNSDFWLVDSWCNDDVTTKWWRHWHKTKYLLSEIDSNPVSLSGFFFRRWRLLVVGSIRDDSFIFVDESSSCVIEDESSSLFCWFCCFEELLLEASFVSLDARWWLFLWFVPVRSGLGSDGSRSSELSRSRRSRCLIWATYTAKIQVKISVQPIKILT